MHSPFKIPLEEQFYRLPRIQDFEEAALNPQPRARTLNACLEGAARNQNMLGVSRG